MLKPTTRKIISLFAALCISAFAQAEVSVIKGKTPIPEGEATDPLDLTVQNDNLAFALAIGSSAPWGVPRGALVDLSVVKNQQLLGDKMAFADFIPNAWSAWPNDGKTVEIITDTPEKATIKITRNFGNVDIETWYTLEAGSDRVALKTVMTNKGEAALKLNSGFTLWPDAGHMFPVPGLKDGKLRQADTPSDRTVAYNQDWAFALHAPYFQFNIYDGKDMYQTHSLQAGESRTFNAWLQVVPDGDLAPVVKAEAIRRDEPTGLLFGNLTDTSGNAPDDGLVIVEKNHALYAWTRAKDGHYKIELPSGDYQLYGTARGHANSKISDIHVSAGSEQSLNFTQLSGPGTLALTLTDADNGKPLDGRISILKGQDPAVEFLGKRTFFTKLAPKGKADVILAPGEYTVGIASGAGFVSQQSTLDIVVEEGKTAQKNVKITKLTKPTKRGWYGADLHHHGNILEAITPPETVVRAQLASALDLIFLSEHDSTANFPEYTKLSASRGVPFIPSIEVSPSWGHINPFPIDLDAKLTVDPGTDDIHTLIDAIHDMGAEVIAMNHPYNEYGYYTNLEKGAVPGGATDGFDLLELNAATDNTATLDKAHALWDEGQHMYFNAGTDTHDAWNQLSGSIRMMGHVAGDLTTDKFVSALKTGRAFATMGPMLYPQNIMFGDQAEPGARWQVILAAAEGLDEVRLLGEGGKVILQKSLASGENKYSQTLSLTIPADAKGWVSLEVDDAAGHTAWSNPVWLN